MPQKKPIQRPLLLFAKVSSMLLLLRKIELPSVIVWKSFARDQNATQCFRVTSIHRKFITLRKKNTTTDVSMLHIGKEEAKRKKKERKIMPRDNDHCKKDVSRYSWRLEVSSHPWLLTLTTFALTQFTCIHIYIYTQILGRAVFSFAPPFKYCE